MDVVYKLLNYWQGNLEEFSESKKKSPTFHHYYIWQTWNKSIYFNYIYPFPGFSSIRTQLFHMKIPEMLNSITFQAELSLNFPCKKLFTGFPVIYCDHCLFEYFLLRTSNVFYTAIGSNCIIYSVVFTLFCNVSYCFVSLCQFDYAIFGHFVKHPIE